MNTFIRAGRGRGRAVKVDACGASVWVFDDHHGVAHNSFTEPRVLFVSQVGGSYWELLVWFTTENINYAKW